MLSTLVYCCDRGLRSTPPGVAAGARAPREVSLGSCRFFVLDEADRMLDMGFTKALTEIFGYLPEEKQVRGSEVEQ